VKSPHFEDGVEREGWGMEPVIVLGSRSLEGKTRCLCDRRREEWGTASMSGERASTNGE
jgi:hypothetical protein